MSPIRCFQSSYQIVHAGTAPGCSILARGPQSVVHSETRSVLDPPEAAPVKQCAQLAQARLVTLAIAGCR
jgi:hypothetical protein